MIAMRTSVPPSLKWLVERRARAAGEVKRQESRKNALADEISTIENSLAIYRSDILALDRIIATHEIPIDPEKIPCILANHKVLPFDYGQATALISEFFRIRGSAWSSTTEVAAYLWTRAQLGEELVTEFRLAVRQRLRALAQQGRIERTQQAIVRKEACWRGMQSAAGTLSQSTS
jgi:hypothetical protein